MAALERPHEPVALVLPTMALALSSVAVVLRLTRSAMLETMSAGLHPFSQKQGHVQVAHRVEARAA